MYFEKPSLTFWTWLWERELEELDEQLVDDEQRFRMMRVMTFILAGLCKGQKQDIVNSAFDLHQNSNDEDDDVGDDEVIGVDDSTATDEVVYAISHFLLTRYPELAELENIHGPIPESVKRDYRFAYFVTKNMTTDYMWNRTAVPSPQSTVDSVKSEVLQ